MANITLLDVAKHVGVSNATVSMVLRNTGNISDQTRKKVLKALDELGYVYNQTAANLRNKRSNQIGFLLHDISNPFYAEMTAALSNQMEKHNLMLFLANAQEDAVKQQKFIASLQRNSASGLILIPALNTPKAYLESLKQQKIPVVTVARRSIDVAFDYVGIDNFAGIQLVTEHLLQLGHKQIAFIGGNSNSINRSVRLGGFMSKLLEYGLKVNEEWLVPCPANQIAASNIAFTFLKNNPKVTAAVCYIDVVAMGVMLALRELGREVGKDFSVTGFDDINEASLIQPSLTTISVCASEMGKIAAELLYSRINGNDEPVKNVIIPAQLVIRESTAQI